MRCAVLDAWLCTEAAWSLRERAAAALSTQWVAQSADRMSALFRAVHASLLDHCSPRSLCVSQRVSGVSVLRSTVSAPNDAPRRGRAEGATSRAPTQRTAMAPPIRRHTAQLCEQQERPPTRAFRCDIHEQKERGGQCNTQHRMARGAQKQPTRVGPVRPIAPELHRCPPPVRPRLTSLLLSALLSSALLFCASLRIPARPSPHGAAPRAEMSDEIPMVEMAGDDDDASEGAAVVVSFAAHVSFAATPVASPVAAAASALPSIGADTTAARSLLRPPILTKPQLSLSFIPSALSDPEDDSTDEEDESSEEAETEGGTGTDTDGGGAESSRLSSSAQSGDFESESYSSPSAAAAARRFGGAALSIPVPATAGTELEQTAEADGADTTRTPTITVDDSSALELEDRWKQKLRGRLVLDLRDGGESEAESTARIITVPGNGSARAGAVSPNLLAVSTGGTKPQASRNKDKRGSYEVTSDGTFRTDLYELRKTGFKRTTMLTKKLQRRKAEAEGNTAAAGAADGSAASSSNTIAGDSSSATAAAAVAGSSTPAVSYRTSKGFGTGKLTSLTLEQMGLLGRGASGQVTKCLHVPTMTIVAVKSIDVTERSRRAQLVQELFELDTLDCEHLVEFMGAYYEEGHVFLALEFMDRGAMDSIVRRLADGDHPAKLPPGAPKPPPRETLSEPVLSNCFRQILSGLHYLHAQQKIHRDVKPGNFLLNHCGQLKLSDFGLTSTLDGMKGARDSFVGTTIFMSPERITGGEYGLSSDIWSVGMSGSDRSTTHATRATRRVGHCAEPMAHCCSSLLCPCSFPSVARSLIYMATGRSPISTEDGYWGIVLNVSARDFSLDAIAGPAYSQELRDFCGRCLTKDPAARATAAELLEHPWIRNGPQSVAETLPFYPASLGMGVDREDPSRLAEHAANCHARQRNRKASMKLRKIQGNRQTILTHKVYNAAGGERVEGDAELAADFFDEPDESNDGIMMLAASPPPSSRTGRRKQRTGGGSTILRRKNTMDELEIDSYSRKLRKEVMRASCDQWDQAMADLPSPESAAARARQADGDAQLTARGIAAAAAAANQLHTTDMRHGAGAVSIGLSKRVGFAAAPPQTLILPSEYESGALSPVAGSTPSMHLADPQAQGVEAPEAVSSSPPITPAVPASPATAAAQSSPKIQSANSAFAAPHLTPQTAGRLLYDASDSATVSAAVSTHGSPRLAQVTVASSGMALDKLRSLAAIASVGEEEDGRSTPTTAASAAAASLPSYPRTHVPTPPPQPFVEGRNSPLALRALRVRADSLGGDGRYSPHPPVTDSPKLSAALAQVAQAHAQGLLGSSGASDSARGAGASSVGMEGGSGSNTPGRSRSNRHSRIVNGNLIVFERSAPSPPARGSPARGSPARGSPRVAGSSGVLDDLEADALPHPAMHSHHVNASIVSVTSLTTANFSPCASASSTPRKQLNLQIAISNATAPIATTPVGTASPTALALKLKRIEQEGRASGSNGNSPMHSRSGSSLGHHPTAVIATGDLVLSALPAHLRKNSAGVLCVSPTAGQKGETYHQPIMLAAKPQQPHPLSSGTSPERPQLATAVIPPPAVLPPTQPTPQPTLPLARAISDSVIPPPAKLVINTSSLQSASVSPQLSSAASSSPSGVSSMHQTHRSAGSIEDVLHSQSPSSIASLRKQLQRQISPPSQIKIDAAAELSTPVKDKSASSFSASTLSPPQHQLLLPTMVRPGPLMLPPVIVGSRPTSANSRVMSARLLDELGQGGSTAVAMLRAPTELGAIINSKRPVLGGSSANVTPRPLSPMPLGSPVAASPQHAPLASLPNSPPPLALVTRTNSNNSTTAQLSARAGSPATSDSDCSPSQAALVRRAAANGSNNLTVNPRMRTKSVASTSNTASSNGGKQLLSVHSPQTASPQSAPVSSSHLQTSIRGVKPSQTNAAWRSSGAATPTPSSPAPSSAAQQGAVPVSPSAALGSPALPPTANGKGSIMHISPSASHTFSFELADSANSSACASLTGSPSSAGLKARSTQAADAAAALLQSPSSMRSRAKPTRTKIQAGFPSSGGSNATAGTLAKGTNAPLRSPSAGPPLSAQPGFTGMHISASVYTQKQIGVANSGTIPGAKRRSKIQLTLSPAAAPAAAPGSASGSPLAGPWDSPSADGRGRLSNLSALRSSNVLLNPVSPAPASSSRGRAGLYAALSPDAESATYEHEGGWADHSTSSLLDLPHSSTTDAQRRGSARFKAAPTSVSAAASRRSSAQPRAIILTSPKRASMNSPATNSRNLHAPTSSASSSSSSSLFARKSNNFVDAEANAFAAASAAAGAGHSPTMVPSVHGSPPGARSLRPLKVVSPGASKVGSKRSSVRMGSQSPPAHSSSAQAHAHAGPSMLDLLVEAPLTATADACPSHDQHSMSPMSPSHNSTEEDWHTAASARPTRGGGASQTNSTAASFTVSISALAGGSKRAHVPGAALAPISRKPATLASLQH